MRLDDITQEAPASWSPEEYIANRFAAGLLMPKIAVDAAFAKRGWTVAQPTPEMIFVVAKELGVGFTTLIGYLERTLGSISSATANTLRRTRIPQLRNQIAGFDVVHDVIVVDQHWSRTTIDIDVGDAVVLADTVNFYGACSVLVERPVRHLIGTSPGVGEISIDSPRSPISLRVSRRGFTGLARYRHLEEVADEE
jgi:hypothetical protein